LYLTVIGIPGIAGQEIIPVSLVPLGTRVDSRCVTGLATRQTCIAADMAVSVTSTLIPREGPYRIDLVHSRACRPLRFDGIATLATGCGRSDPASAPPPL